MSSWLLHHVHGIEIEIAVPDSEIAYRACELLANSDPRLASYYWDKFLFSDECLPELMSLATNGDIFRPLGSCPQLLHSFRRKIFPTWHNSQSVEGDHKNVRKQNEFASRTDVVKKENRVLTKSNLIYRQQRDRNGLKVD